MGIPSDHVSISFNIPRSVRDNINMLKKKDPRISRRIIFLEGYKIYMGLQEDDKYNIQKEREEIELQIKTLSARDSELEKRLEELEYLETQQEIKKNETVERNSKIVDEIIRVAPDIIFYKNKQLLEYVRSLIPHHSLYEVAEFFDRSDIPTKKMIRDFAERS